MQRPMRRVQALLANTMNLSICILLVLQHRDCSAEPTVRTERLIDHRCIPASIASRNAAEICSSTPISDALAAQVGVAPQVAAFIGEQLAAHDLAIALDLRLLAPPERDELFGTLKAGGVSIGVRSKLKLLTRSKIDEVRSWDLRAGAAPSSSANENAPLKRLQSYGTATPFRRTQENAVGASWSLDSIIIMLSVVLGIAGYILQAWSSQRANAAAAELSHKNQLSDTRRQREHEQMVFQMHRTERWMDECARPILEILFIQMFSTTYGFIHDALPILETTHLEAVNQMAAFVKPMYPLQADGSVISKASGQTMFFATREPAQTHTSKSINQALPSANGLWVAGGYSYACLTQPLCAILPIAILDIVSQDATSDLAVRYRRFVQTTVMPFIRRVVEILCAHGVTLELPPKTWLVQKFSAEAWQALDTDMYLNQWRVIAANYERLVVQWSDGDCNDHLPANHLLPTGGLRAVLQWSLDRGKQKQMELIGMTKADEEDVSDIFEKMFSGDAHAAAAAIDANRAVRKGTGENQTFEDEDRRG